MSSLNWLAESVPVFRRLAQAITRGETFPAVVLGGTEEYLLSEAKTALLTHLLAGANSDFDYFECEAGAIDIKDLNSQLVALPMFGARRVVVLNDFEDLRSDEAKHGLVKRYTADPSPTTSLVMIQPLERKPGKREQTALQNDTSGYWFFELRTEENAKFVRAFTALHDKRIAVGAVEYLLETSTSQLRDLRAKLEHLILYAGVEPEITVEMVMRATGITAEVEMFGFDDALLAGNASRVLREARELLDKGMEELALVGRLRSAASRIWLCGGLAARRATEAEFQAVLGGQVFKKNDFIRASQRLGETRMQDLQLNILQIEMHAKSKGSDVRSLIYEWLWSACSAKKVGSHGTNVNQREYVR